MVSDIGQARCRRSELNSLRKAAYPLSFLCLSIDDGFCRTWTLLRSIICDGRCRALPCCGPPCHRSRDLRELYEEPVVWRGVVHDSPYCSPGCRRQQRPFRARIASSPGRSTTKLRVLVRSTRRCRSGSGKSALTKFKLKGSLLSNRIWLLRRPF